MPTWHYFIGECMGLNKRIANHLLTNEIVPHRRVIYMVVQYVVLIDFPLRSLSSGRTNDPPNVQTIFSQALNGNSTVAIKYFLFFIFVRDDEEQNKLHNVMATISIYNLPRPKEQPRNGHCVLSLALVPRTIAEGTRK